MAKPTVNFFARANLIPNWISPADCLRDTREVVLVVIDFRAVKEKAASAPRKEIDIRTGGENGRHRTEKKKKERYEKIPFASVYEVNFGDLNSTWTRNAPIVTSFQY